MGSESDSKLSPMDEAEIRRIDSEVVERMYKLKLTQQSFYQRWAIIWLTLGGVFKFEVIKEVLSWIANIKPL
jgi:hypothetical protein